MATTPTRRKRLRRLREAPARFIGRTPWLRRRYARRILRTIDKFQDKGRALPDNLVRLERQLRRVPKPKRQQLVEQMMEMGSEDDVTSNRALRRAAGRQERQKGQRGGGLRPGTLPGQPR
ncbi:MAG TPA: hypothetical protein VMD28_00730, partial [Acidimicrobiales bacterium]|nr:hypothetical protein [Acidimicrobiales bacterium]